MDIQKLTKDVKQKVHVTWDDEDTNSKIDSTIQDALATLNHKLGATIDYSQPGMEHNLFLNYCMYAWNDCVSDFDTNYMREIYQVRAIYEVKHYEENPV